MSIKVSTSVLQGHTSSVLCVSLDHINNTSRVAAGAESGACPVRVWDTRIDSKRSVLAIHKKSTDTLDAFADGVTSVAFAPGHHLFCSWSRSVAAFDLRRTDRVLQTFDDHSWLLDNFAEDEVNQISVSAVQPSGKWSVACCEDGGDVHVFRAGVGNGEDNDELDDESESTGLGMGIGHSCLSGVHVNMCTGVRWQHGSDRLLVSGSMDSTICMWSTMSGRPIAGGHITCGPDNAGASTSGGTQLLNPPYVNSLDVGRRACAVGLGDGTIGIYDVVTQRPIGQRLRGHDAATACVTFVRGALSEEEEEVGASGMGRTEGMTKWEDDLLFSAGNDRKICLWNLNGRGGRGGGDRKKSSEYEAEGDWDDQLCDVGSGGSGGSKKSRANKSKKNKSKKNGKRRKKKTRAATEEELEGKGEQQESKAVAHGDELEEDSHIPLRFEHPYKINWLDASSTSRGVIRLFVADESNDVTVYSGFQ